MERGIVNRERSANSYSVSAYYPAKVFSEWPLRCLPTVIFVLIAYWPIKFQRTASHFFLFLLTEVLEFSAMNATGLLVCQSLSSYEFTSSPFLTLSCAELNR